VAPRNALARRCRSARDGCRPGYRPQRWMCVWRHGRLISRPYCVTSSHPPSEGAWGQLIHIISHTGWGSAEWLTRSIAQRRMSDEDGHRRSHRPQRSAHVSGQPRPNSPLSWEPGSSRHLHSLMGPWLAQVPVPRCRSGRGTSRPGNDLSTVGLTGAGHGPSRRPLASLTPPVYHPHGLWFSRTTLTAFKIYLCSRYHSRVVARGGPHTPL
jgi:hypothetical protein